MATNLKSKAADAYAKGRSKATEAMESGKAKAESAARATRSGAQSAARKTVESVDRNPVAAVLGGLALGAIAAALLPKTQREDKLVGNVGKKVRKTAADARAVATKTAKEKLDNLGVNGEAAKSQLRDLIGKIGEAAQSAGSAAVDTVRKR